jgi:gliding motility-associated-like protein
MGKTAYPSVSSEAYKRIIICVFILIHLQSFAQKDLPGPSPSIQVAPAGSFVIPMDNSYQSIVPAGQAPFNLKAYGLINAFLQNGIPVKWVIKSDKQRDDIDFTGLVERIAPSFVTATTIDFRGGPFIVPDTVLPCGESSMGIIKAFGNNVAVYKLVNSVSVDVRYTLTHRPKIAVFNNGGNQQIHTKILDAAGIGDYDVMDAKDIEALKNCYTFASEPHADDSDISQVMIDGVRAFVLNGGNFLAQCHAIGAYENKGFYQTTSGVQVVNSKVSHHYPNANMAFAQIHGPTTENAGGSVVNWNLKSGSSWKPYTYPLINFSGSEPVVATGAHLIAPSAPGGNVFYLGGHDYAKNGGKNATVNLANIGDVNALRLYLNAALIPSGNTNGVWANAGPASHSLSCKDGVQLGCEQTGPPGSTFLWSPPTGLSCTTCPNPIATPSVTTTYTLKVSNTCIAIDTVRVIVGPKPVAKFSATTVCEGQATSFTNQSANATYWQWYFGDPASGTNNTSTLKSPTHIFTAPGNYSVMLIAGIDSTCADTLIQTVTVKPLPPLNVQSDTICQGQSLKLTASGASTYSWSNGQSTSSITVTPAVSTTYIVTGTKDGCSAKDTARVTVSPTMKPMVATSPVKCFGGTDGTATVSITGGIPDYTYHWNTHPAQTTAQADGLAAGEYVLIITDRAGCTAVTPVSITEPPALHATIEVSNATCNSNDGAATVTVSGGTPSYSYSWNTHPIQTSAHASNLYRGSYTVTVTDKNGCSTDVPAIIKSLYTITLTTSTENVTCHGGSDGSAEVMPSGGTPSYTYLWNTLPVQTTPKATNLFAGSYKVTIRDANGCMLDTIITIDEPAPISVSIQTINPTCISGGKATVSASGGTPPYSFSWATTPVQTTELIADLTPGSYIVTVTDHNACQTVDSVRLNPPPQPLADFSFTSSCIGTSTAFIDNSSVITGTILSREWNFGNDKAGSRNFSTEKNPEHLYDSIGLYTAQLIVTTDLGCKDTIVKQVEIHPYPVVQFGEFAQGCEAVCADFKDASFIVKGTINEWLWEFGDPSSSSNTSTLQNPTHCYNQPGSYHVTLRVTSDHGCISQLTIPDLVKVYKAPAVDLGPDQKICTETEEAAWRILNAGTWNKYLWQPSGDTTQYLSVNRPGVYKVTVTDENNCTATELVNVREVCPPRLYIGNAFSPDGDGINDRYNVHSAHIGKFQMLIFNRWGEIIFESRSPEHYWDGYYRDEPMPVGVYPWIITYEGDSEEYRGPYKLEGSVTVVR